MLEKTKAAMLKFAENVGVSVFPLSSMKVVLWFMKPSCWALSIFSVESTKKEIGINFVEFFFRRWSCVRRGRTRRTSQSISATRWTLCWRVLLPRSKIMTRRRLSWRCVPLELILFKNSLYYIFWFIFPKGTPGYWNKGVFYDN